MPNACGKFGSRTDRTKGRIHNHLRHAPVYGVPMNPQHGNCTPAAALGEIRSGFGAMKLESERWGKLRPLVLVVVCACWPGSLESIPQTTSRGATSGRLMQSTKPHPVPLFVGPPRVRSKYIRQDRTKE